MQSKFKKGDLVVITKKLVRDFGRKTIPVGTLGTIIRPAFNDPTSGDWRVSIEGLGRELQEDGTLIYDTDFELSPIADSPLYKALK